MTLLNVEGLKTRLVSEAGWVEAIDDLSLSIKPGETFALVGESGCGKSMTALSIARLLPEAGAVVAGKVALKGPEGGYTDLLRISQATMRTIRGKRVSMIFQEPSTSLNPVMTIGDQLAEVLCLHTGCNKANALQEAELWLGKVGIPEPKARLKQYPFEMSGGQKQRVMIAMALAVKPDVLIADEPTTALDVLIQAQVLALLKTLQRDQGMAMLLITHDLALVQHMADTVGLMYAGQLVEVASSAEFFASPKHPYAHALLKSLPSQAQVGKALFALEGRVPSLINPLPGCRFAARCAHRRDACVEETPAMRQASEHHQVRCVRYDVLNLDDLKQTPILNGLAREEQEQPVFELKALRVAYPSKAGWFRTAHQPVVKGVDLALFAGKTLALVGESGSGKTTLARALLGLLPKGSKVEGNILLKGKVRDAWPEHGNQGWRSKVQFVFQDPFASLNPRHRVMEILEEPLLSLRSDLDAQQRQTRLYEMIEHVGLPKEALLRFPHEFSGGQRQRIAIARALMSEPEVLICDEPTSALDVSVQAQILNLLRRLQHDTGVAMLFITHNLGVVRYFADQVLVLRHGEMVEQGCAADVFEAPKQSYTRELIAAAPVLTSNQGI